MPWIHARQSEVVIWCLYISAAKNSLNQYEGPTDRAGRLGLPGRSATECHQSTRINSMKYILYCEYYKNGQLLWNQETENSFNRSMLIRWDSSANVLVLHHLE